MSYYTDFQAYIGEVAGGSTVNYTTPQVTTWLTEGAKMVINRLPRNLLWNVATTTSFSTSGTPITTQKILEVSRSDGNYVYPCRQVQAGQRGLAQNPKAVEYAYKTDPVSYTKDGYIYILPSPSASELGYIQHVQFPTVSYSDSAITNFPDELEPYPLHYAVIQGLNRANSYIRQNVQTEISNATGALSTFVTTLPSLAGYTWSDTDIDDALTKAQELIDTTGTINVTTRLNSDDLELSEGAVSAAAQEIRRAGQAIQKELGKLQEYQVESNLDTSKAQTYLQQAQSYMTTADRYLSQSQSIQQTIKTKMQEWSEGLDRYIQMT